MPWPPLLRLVNEFTLLSDEDATAATALPEAEDILILGREPPLCLLPSVNVGLVSPPGPPVLLPPLFVEACHDPLIEENGAGLVIEPDARPVHGTSPGLGPRLGGRLKLACGQTLEVIPTVALPLDRLGGLLSETPGLKPTLDPSPNPLRPTWFRGVSLPLESSSSFGSSSTPSSMFASM